MSHNSKLEAETAANDCLKLMKTKGWKVCVHQNLGWHWCLEHVEGHFLLSGSHLGGYYTLLSEGNHAHSGSYNWSTGVSRFKDPNEAVEYQLLLAHHFAKKTMDWVNKVDKTINSLD